MVIIKRQGVSERITGPLLAVRGSYRVHFKCCKNLIWSWAGSIQSVSPTYISSSLTPICKCTHSNVIHKKLDPRRILTLELGVILPGLFCTCRIALVWVLALLSVFANVIQKLNAALAAQKKHNFLNKNTVSVPGIVTYSQSRTPFSKAARKSLQPNNFPVTSWTNKKTRFIYLATKITA